MPLVQQDDVVHAHDLPGHRRDAAHDVPHGDPLVLPSRWRARHDALEGVREPLIVAGEMMVLFEKAWAERQHLDHEAYKQDEGEQMWREPIVARPLEVLVHEEGLVNDPVDALPHRHRLAVLLAGVPADAAHRQAAVVERRAGDLLPVLEVLQGVVSGCIHGARHEVERPGLAEARAGLDVQLTQVGRVHLVTEGRLLLICLLGHALEQPPGGSARRARHHRG
mmetsp:Transcript_106894/g.302269  ORF Transcript_106894/g.302269 Transcript_106894/m.302269 type:complete len:223 (-) Transcript_106894:1057-1725(-)